jgi:hypothetical protein
MQQVEVAAVAVPLEAQTLVTEVLVALRIMAVVQVDRAL